MRIPATALLLTLLVGCSPPTPSENEPSAVPASEPSHPEEVAPPATTPPAGWLPDQACSFIGENFGVAVRPYKNDYEDEFSCSTPYKNLQEGQDLPNNLAYYVEGKQNLATEVKLVLNINERAKETYARAQLQKYSSIVAKAATGDVIPADISNAITSGAPKTHESNGYKQELKRDDWPTGKGYELHYVVTKVGEG